MFTKKFLLVLVAVLLTTLSTPFEEISGVVFALSRFGSYNIIFWLLTATDVVVKVVIFFISIISIVCILLDKLKLAKISFLILFFLTVLNFLLYNFSVVVYQNIFFWYMELLIGWDIWNVVPYEYSPEDMPPWWQRDIWGWLHKISYFFVWFCAVPFLVFSAFLQCKKILKNKIRSSRKKSMIIWSIVLVVSSIFNLLFTIGLQVTLHAFTFFPFPLFIFHIISLITTTIVSLITLGLWSLKRVLIPHTKEILLK